MIIFLCDYLFGRNFFGRNFFSLLKISPELLGMHYNYFGAYFDFLGRIVETWYGFSGHCAGCPDFSNRKHGLLVVIFGGALFFWKHTIFRRNIVKSVSSELKPCIRLHFRSNCVASSLS